MGRLSELYRDFIMGDIGGYVALVALIITIGACVLFAIIDKVD